MNAKREIKDARVLVTHVNPHTDELGVRAILLFLFPHFAGLPVYYISASSEMSWEGDIGAMLRKLGYTKSKLRGVLSHDYLWEKCGILFYGTGGGPLDDHTGGRSKPVSATKICADTVGKGLLPETLKELIKYIDWEDIRPDERQVSLFDLASLVRAMRNTGQKDEKIFAWFKLAFDAFCVEYDESAIPFKDRKSQFEEVVTEWLLPHLHVEGTELKPTVKGTLLHYKKDKVKDWKVLGSYCSSLRTAPHSHFKKTHLCAIYSRIRAVIGVGQANEWLEFALDVHAKDQYKFWHILVPEYKKVKRIETVETNRGTCLIAVCPSELNGLDKVARHLDEAHVIVMLRPDGHVQIMASRGPLRELYPERVVDGEDRFFDDVIYELRMEEQRVRGMTPIQDDFHELTDDGFPCNVPSWFYMGHAHFILNGSGSATNIPPTAISHDRVVALVKEGMKPGEEVTAVILSAFSPPGSSFVQ